MQKLIRNEVCSLMLLTVLYASCRYFKIEGTHILEIFVILLIFSALSANSAVRSLMSAVALATIIVLAYILIFAKIIGAVIYASFVIFILFAVVYVMDQAEDLNLSKKWVAITALVQGAGAYAILMGINRFVV